MKAEAESPNIFNIKAKMVSNYDCGKSHSNPPNFRRAEERIELLSIPEKSFSKTLLPVLIVKMYRKRIYFIFFV